MDFYFILEIQIFVLKVKFTQTVWRPKGGAQHSKHALLQERCICGTQSSEEKNSENSKLSCSF